MYFGEKYQDNDKAYDTNYYKMCIRDRFEAVKMICDWAARRNLLHKVEVLGFVDGHTSVSYTHLGSLTPFNIPYLPVTVTLKGGRDPVHALCLPVRW